MNINVKVRGPLFEKKISDVIEQAIVVEALDKIEDRLSRKGAEGSGGRGLGVKRNVITSARTNLELRVFSSRKFPRTKGTAWQRKNVAIVRAMAPRVLRAVAKRAVAELGG